jgi:mycofactocin glycosyltransferase
VTRLSADSARPAVATPAQLGLRADQPMPAGLAVELDPGVSQLTGDVLFGGSPARVLRLSPAGVAALAELRQGPVASAAAAVLARRLTDTGLAHPRLSGDGAGPDVTGLDVTGLDVTGLDVTVVVPVLDRPRELDRCLAAAGTRFPVVVVDDGSADPAATAAVCAARGARLIRRDVNGGPGPARNTALAQVGTELVAFLDSDCVPPPGWIEALAGHLADPLVAAVAPRIVPLAAVQAGGPAPGGVTLDLGDRPARVAPMTRVAYVPTAALLVRRSALGGGFDETLRNGEDVDLVWRLIEAGWRVRYEPAVQVRHDEPATRAALLRRRFRYGTSAAPLTRRHPGAVTPLVLQPWPTLTMTALLARRPLTAGTTFAVSTALLDRRLRASGLPAEGLVRPMAEGVRQTWLGTGRWCGQFAAPAVAALIVYPGGRTARARWGRRLAAASLLAGPPLAEWAARRDTSLLRHTAVTLADQAAYGAGVYAGCLRERLITPVLPSIAWQPFQGLTPASARRRRGSRC